MIEICKFNNLNNSHELLLQYFHLVDKDFGVPLSDKIDINEFCEKLLKYGHVIAIKKRNVIVGIIGFYCNDHVLHIAHIPILSTLSVVRGKGYAKILLLKTLEYCKEYQMKIIRCDSINPIAVHAYKSAGFICSKVINDNGIQKYFLEYHIK